MRKEPRPSVIMWRFPVRVCVCVCERWPDSSAIFTLLLFSGGTMNWVTDKILVPASFFFWVQLLWRVGLPLCVCVCACVWGNSCPSVYLCLTCWAILCRGGCRTSEWKLSSVDDNCHIPSDPLSVCERPTADTAALLEPVLLLKVKHRFESGERIGGNFAPLLPSPQRCVIQLNVEIREGWREEFKCFFEGFSISCIRQTDLWPAELSVWLLVNCWYTWLLMLSCLFGAGHLCCLFFRIKRIQTCYCTWGVGGGGGWQVLVGVWWVGGVLPWLQLLARWDEVLSLFTHL